jgi:predicted DNA-binding protein with PD1-like motif
VRTVAVRLRPGTDLRVGLESLAAREAMRAGVVVTCVGSLSVVSLRMANRHETDRFEGDYEIVSLVGTLSPDGPHLHLSVSDDHGRVLGGHLQEGSIVRTTAEVVLGELEDVEFHRPIDPVTTWDELEVRPRPDVPPRG